MELVMRLAAVFIALLSSATPGMSSVIVESIRKDIFVCLDMFENPDRRFDVCEKALRDANKLTESPGDHTDDELKWALHFQLAASIQLATQLVDRSDFAAALEKVEYHRKTSDLYATLYGTDDGKDLRGYDLGKYVVVYHLNEKLADEEWAISELERLANEQDSGGDTSLRVYLLQMRAAAAVYAREFDEAWDFLDKVEKLSSPGDAQYDRGQAKAAMGDFAAAAQHFKAAMVHAEKQGDVYYPHPFAYGEALAKAGNPDEGFTIFEEPFRVDPKPSWVKLFQYKLIKRGLLNGVADGVYGARSRAAMKECLRLPDCVLWMDVRFL